MNKHKLGLIFFIIAIIAVVFYWFLGAQPAKQHTQKPLYWVSPMDPSYRSDKPGKSPMGMDLVPVYAKNNTQKNRVFITPNVINNLGVRTTTVKRGDLYREISTVGYVAADEDGISHVHTYTDGWVKKLYVKTQGEHVNEGQLLLDLYSPTLVNAQEEYLLAIRTNNTNLMSASKRKLLTLGMSEQQIARIKKMQNANPLVQIYATQSGIVADLNVREGMYVNPGRDLMTLEKLSPIWVIVEIYERQANWVNVGQTVIAHFPYLPEKNWHGKVDFVYPQLDAKTRTLRVRLRFDNRDETLKPNMYANVKILATPVKDVLSIPTEAIIRTGRGERVIVALGNGHFKPQTVTTGIESGTRTEITSGLKAGQRIVSSSEFLIDSESNLQASFNRMQTDNTISANTQQPNKENHNND